MRVAASVIAFPTQTLHRAGVFIRCLPFIQECVFSNFEFDSSLSSSRVTVTGDRRQTRVRYFIIFSSFYFIRTGNVTIFSPVVSKRDLA